MSRPTAVLLLSTGQRGRRPGSTAHHVAIFHSTGEDRTRASEDQTREVVADQVVVGAD